MKICKSAETKEVTNFLSSNFNLYGIPKKIKSDKGGAFISKEDREFCENPNIEIEHCTPRIYVERAIQTLKNLIITNMEDGVSLTESVYRALRIMRFTIHTGLKLTPFELHHGRKPRTELTNIVKDGKSYLSNWSELSVSATNRPQNPHIYGPRCGWGHHKSYCDGEDKSRGETLHRWTEFTEEEKFGWRSPLFC